MAKSERLYKGSTREINIEQGASAVVLLTTTNEKEIFPDVEGMINGKRRERNKELVKGTGLMLVGGIIGLVSAASEIPGTKIPADGFGLGLAMAFSFWAFAKFNNAALASDQLGQIKSELDQLKPQSK